MSLFDRAVVALLPLVPRPMVRHFSRPYIAGTRLDEAIATIRSLNERKMLATLDVLGEHIVRIEEADGPRESYRAALDEIERAGVQANVSVKLSQFGLKIDREICYRNIHSLVRHAKERNNWVRIDMEDSSCTDDTLEIYRRLREEFDNVGFVLQSMLRRSLSDLRKFLPSKPNVRICKGIYVEPWREAYRDPVLVNRSYVQMVRELAEAGGYPAIATHDERLVFECTRIVEELRVPRDRYEFQMLLGVREDLRQLTIEGGHRLRVYVPFGEQWYAYSIRRMRENPRVAGMVARTFLPGGNPNGAGRRD